MDACDLSSLRKVSGHNQNRLYIEYDFVQVIRQYLETEPGSKERKQFVEERHRLIEEIAEVRRHAEQILIENLRN